MFADKSALKFLHQDTENEYYISENKNEDNIG